MTGSLDPDDVLEVAYQLHTSHDQIEVDRWEAVESARARSAISRAYYSAFLTLKVRLIETGEFPTEFPTGGIHSAIDRALAKHAANFRLCREFRSLRDWRENADYELDLSFDTVNAEDAFAQAERVIDNIVGLSDDRILRMAKEIRR